MWISKRDKVKIILEESFYGKTQSRYGKAFCFYSYRNGNVDLITVRNSEILIAVTKDQFNAWKNLDIFVVPAFITKSQSEDPQLFLFD